MSLRLLKKVLQEQEGLQHQIRHGDVDDDDDEEHLNESESIGTGARSLINPFDLLDDDDQDSDSNKEIEPVIADEKTNEIYNPPSDINAQPGAPSGQKKKKKKKKKGKEGASSAAKTESSLDETLEALSLDDVASTGQRADAKKEKVQSAKACASSSKKASQCALKVDPKYLNVENELRRIFGAKVVKSFEKGNQGRIRGGRRGTHHIRKTFLISPSEHWTRWDGSFSMEFLETKDGYHYFRYVHSPSYQQAQNAFQAAQAIHDLNGVASVLIHHPYHLDSLVTMADYFRFVGEHQMAADSIGKCLYALECAWHPMFTPFEGNCQLKFSHETNKPLFTTLFTHMRSMDRRGCHRSALEVCKLLLSLDSDNPVGALFCVDYFALRAEEYAWLELFSEEYKTDSSLWLFPNFSYSLAISRFYLEKMESSSGDTPKSNSLDLMKQALMLHPAVLKKLVAKVPLKDQAWTKILKHSYFRSDQSKIPSVDHLINIYVERSYLIWRLPEVQKLLRSAAERVIESLEQNEDDAKDWICVRKEAFPSEKNEYAHLTVQDYSDTVPTLPPDNLQNFVVDPRMVEQGAEGIDEGGGRLVPQPAREVANRNPLAVLFESMLPWVHYGEADDPNNGNHQPDGEGHGHGQH
ncbi:PREDICTED: transcription factor 25 [Tarenaya hassleriana]|uniref:transcription factor 25 n=1 Tax=Tarenaya hassleriana TaxID=28532 RepID=UPI00053C2429|nr:PREDICTED: transcription factor 25 [Tarenaya hassleriana]